MVNRKKILAAITGAFAVAIIVLAVARPVSANTGRVSLSPDPTSVVEGQDMVVTVHLDEPIITEEEEGYVTINLTSSDPGLLSLSDSSITFPASEWSGSKSFTISALPDSVTTGHQSLTVSFSTDSNSEYYDGFTGDIDVTFIDIELSGQFAGGIGTESDPYLVANCVQLASVGSDPLLADSYYKLANTIDCSDTVNWNGGEGWAPLASFTNRFAGTLDGDNNSITGLWSLREPAPGLGLFSYTEDATFKNLNISGTIANSTEDLGTCSGAIAGAVFGSITIENVRSTTNISGLQDTIGGLVGCILNGDGASIITDSSVDATLSLGAIGGLVGDADISGASSLTIEHSTSTGTFSGSEMGGILRRFVYRDWDSVSSSPALNILDCGSSANISVTNVAGGLVENIVLDHRWATIQDAYFTGSIEASAGSGVAGLVNRVSTFDSNPAETIIQRSYASTLITSAAGNVGGLVGVVSSDHAVSIEESYFGGIIDATGDFVGGLIASSDGSSVIENSYADAELSGDQYVGGLLGAGVADISNSFAFGTITSSGTALGGIAGSISGGTIEDSFAAVSVPANQPTTIGGLAGAISDMTIENAYVDAGRTEQACYFTSGPGDSSSVDCNTVNDDGSDPNHYFDTAVSAPLDQWDFDTVWSSNAYFYPCLQWQDFCQTFEPQMLCEMATATATTAHAACDIQVRSGYEYGETTWEARYKKSGDLDYKVYALSDNTLAEMSLTGLEPVSDYYLEFRFTNNWGVGEWGRVEVRTLEGQAEGSAATGSARSVVFIQQSSGPYSNRQINLADFLEFLSNGKQVTGLREGDVLTFQVDNEWHTITIQQILDDTVIVLIQSEPQTANLMPGRSTTFDVNGDNTNDIELTLDEIADKTASITFKQLRKPLATTASSSSITEEEVQSRTERYGWVVWLVVGVAAALLSTIYLKNRHLVHTKQESKE